MKTNYSINWLLQKIFALVFVVFFFYTILSLSNVDLQSFESTIVWFSNYFNSFVILILFLTIILHSNIGLSSIIDDYIHNKNLKKNILLFKNFFFFSIILLLTLSLFSIIK